MSYLVQLHIFSGRPDPILAISDAQAGELFEAQRLRPQQLFEQHSAAETAGARARGGLGYRGFSLIETPAEHPQDAVLAARPSKILREAYLCDAPDVERQLLELAAPRLAPAVVEAARQGLAQRTEALAGTKEKCPQCNALLAPSYNPGYWNNTSSRLLNNNCYNYANNQATNTFAQPGRATGNMYTAFTCASVRPAAVSDGLKAKPNFTAPQLLGWYVALVIWPGVDYHWYRQDKNGCWSHKPGSTEARNLDNSQNTITDPKTCDRGPYSVFCTYMKTNKNVQIN